MSEIDPNSPKDRGRWADVISESAGATPTELAASVERHSWLLSDATDGAFRLMVSGSVERAQLRRALDVEYRRLLLRAFAQRGPAATVAIVIPDEDPAQRVAQLRAAVVRGAQGGDEEALLLRQFALFGETSGGEAKAALHNLGSGLQLRFRRDGDQSDLALALLVYRSTLQLLEASDHPELIETAVANTAGAMALWEQATGESTHRDTAIGLYRQLLLTTPAGDPSRASNAVSLAGLLVAEGRTPGRGFAPLDEAEEVVREALPVLVGVNEAQRLNGLIHLASAALLRFERAGRPEPAREAVAIATQAVDELPADDPERRRLAGLLGRIVAHTVDLHRDPQLGDAVTALLALTTGAAGTVAREAPGTDSLLDQMQALLNRYEAGGSTEDLDGALATARQALDEAKPGSTHEILARTGLGSALKAKYAVSGDVGDLDTAVTELRRAVEAQPAVSPPVPAAFQNLGGVLLERYSHRQQSADLDDAIGVLTRQLALTPTDDARRLGRAAGLADARRLRYLHSRQRRDLDEPIELIRGALAGAQPHHAHRAIALSTLGLCLRHRFLSGGDLGDIREATVLLRNAVEQTPPTAPNLEPLLGNYLLMLTAPESRDRELRGLSTTELQWWAGATLPQALERCRTTGDVPSVVAGLAVLRDLS